MALVARNLALVSLGLVLALVTFQSSAEQKEVFPFPFSSKVPRSDDLDSEWTEWKRTLLGSGAIQSNAVVHAPSGLNLSRLLRRVLEKNSSSPAARAPSTTTAEEIPLLSVMRKRTAAMDDLRYLTSEDLAGQSAVGRPVKRTVCCTMDMYCFVCGKK